MTRPARKPSPSRRIPARVLSQMTSSLWGIRQDMLQRMITLASREAMTVSDVSALAERPTRAIGDSAEMVVRDGVAIIPFIGPGFRYASMMTEICGAVSYEKAALAFGAALADPAVKAIVWEINSPGGEVTGCADLARMVYNARGIKPIVAFVDGDASSAAYWVASACEHIVASSTATLGCLGVLGTYEDRTEADAKEGLKTYTIVSSQTPNKRPDLDTPEGLALIQSSIDDTADIFLGDVAKHRGIHPDDVAEQFGAGGIFVGRKAVKAGLADEIGTFEEVLQELGSGNNSALDVASRPSIVPGNAASSARRKAGNQGTKMTTTKLRSKLASRTAGRRAADEDTNTARRARARRASDEDNLAEGEDDLAEGEDDLAEGEDEPVARRSKRGAKRGARGRAEGEDDLAEGEDDLAEGEDDEFAEGEDDEFAEGEDDEFAEGEDDEFAEGEDEPVARRSKRGARRSRRASDEDLAEGEDDDLAEGEDEPVARRSKRGARGAYGAKGRIAAILNSRSAVGRGRLAKYLALETSVSPRLAFGILQHAAASGAAPSQASRQGDGFRDRMRGLGNPKISNARGGGQAVGEDDIVAQTLAFGQRLGMSSIPKKGQ